MDIKDLQAEINEQYLEDDNNRPWIIGFSGGKDSTMLLQLVWSTVAKLDPVLRRRQIYVVCNDTMVENPKVAQFVQTTLKKDTTGCGYTRYASIRERNYAGTYRNVLGQFVG